MNDIIEHLKDKSKAQPFGLRGTGEKAAMRKAGKQNCLHWNCKWVESDSCIIFVDRLTYILKPDYQPQPEFVDIEIEGSDEKRLVLASPSTVARYWGISNACEDPAFQGFYCQFTECFSRVDLSRVAEKCREGHKVVARFVKEA